MGDVLVIIYLQFIWPDITNFNKVVVGMFLLSENLCGDRASEASNKLSQRWRWPV